MASADSCRIGGIEKVGTVELEYEDRLYRIGFDFLLMPACGSVGDAKPLWEQKENILLKFNGGQERQI